jgi:CxxC motif-containing protein (DUF1111 family)
MKALHQSAFVVIASAGLAASLCAADELDIPLGKALFERQWVQAPASVDTADGLGPLFNASACSSCHKGGGAARFTNIDGALGAAGLVIRLGDDHGRPDPYYGRQLQQGAVPGLMSEARIFPDLETADAMGLTRMDARIDLNGPPLAKGAHTDIRTAPSLAGRALIEQVAVDAVLSLADPSDRNHDGISGRARLIDGELGRFGQKATGRSINEQVADAAALDIGLSSREHPRVSGDCTSLETECLRMASIRGAATSGEEISAEMVSLIAAYVRSLKPPAEHRADTPEAFIEVGCGQCHVPTLRAQSGEPLPVYSDLLLHDLGDGLRGGFDDGFAAAGEWRTAPLIDLDSKGGKRRYLHDGRAGTIDEAIRWHGGEAEAARKRFEALTAAEKAALIAFVRSL